MKLLILSLLFCGAMAQNKEPLDSWQTCQCSSKFRFFTDQVTWAQAQSNCLALGGHLAVINNRVEEDFVKGLTDGQLTWIGLSDTQQDNFWFWVNSEPVSFTNWCPGEPIGPLQCVVINDTPQKCWDDQRCDNLRPYVCEMK